ncbi:hypothetical protein P3X46_027245 [Hevea brasiliensis]|uniref:TAF6 C-terminal HEAT repeat domain-containing protein n=1 Tax=Hevea brasiliensis TaxID=3981 RepID=A0ABQ9KZ87_HEVBR|nr:hypothetical protein P3X46_027245 [Hevea brasiliensis]
MRHSRRTTLTAEDVDSALCLRNVDPVYGFASGDPLRFKRVAGHKDLYYIDDKNVEFKDYVSHEIKVGLLKWARVMGVYLYFDKITVLTMRTDSILFKQALVSLATESGLHPLLPYFTYLIADEVTQNLNNFSVLFALMRVAQSLLQNPHIHIEPYVCLLILPNLEPYLLLLEPEMLLEKQKNEIKGHEAWCIYGALVRAAGICLYDQLKRLPGGHCFQINKDKRKASTDNLMQQPPLQKLATDGATSVMQVNSTQGAIGGYPKAAAASSMGISLMSHQLPTENISGSDSGLVLKTSTMLAQAWKEDTDAGHLLASLCELFSESMFAFIPKPELSFFL